MLSSVRAGGRYGHKVFGCSSKRIGVSTIYCRDFEPRNGSSDDLFIWSCCSQTEDIFVLSCLCFSYVMLSLPSLFGPRDSFWSHT